MFNHPLLLFVWERLHVIRTHWQVVAAVAMLSIIGTFITTRLIDSQQIANQQTQISNQQTHIGFLQDRINVLQQNQAAAAASPPSQWRRLSDRERTSLLSALKLSKPTVLVIYAMADSESRQYAAQFVDVARTAGVDVRPREVPLSSPADVGLMIGLTTYPNPSEEAKRLKDALTSAGLSVHYTLWGKMPDDTSVDFDLFVGPKPW
jgi:hypothetical protein